MADTFNLIFIADIVGEPGLKLLDTMLPSFIKKYDADFVIANAENSHEGRGTNQKILERLFNLGVHAITGGNHSFDKWKVFPYMKKESRILRPLNYPKGNPGYGYGIYEIPGRGKKIGVLNLQGRTYMTPIDDPFSTADWALDRIREETDLVFVDFHAEATAEKMALAWHIDGKASIMVGTHTHIPTNDARILPKGMGYITDVGMTGSFDSVLGMDAQTSMKRFMMATPRRYKLADGNNRICGIHATVDMETAECLHIEPFHFPEFTNSKLDRDE